MGGEGLGLVHCGLKFISSTEIITKIKCTRYSLWFPATLPGLRPRPGHPTAAVGQPLLIQETPALHTPRDLEIESVVGRVEQGRRPRECGQG